MDKTLGDNGAELSACAIAAVARFTCKTYSRRAVKVMKNRGEYGGISAVTAGGGAAYCYQTQFMNETYSRHLWRSEEAGWRNYP